MKPETRDEAKRLLSLTESEDVENQVQATRLSDPMMSLRNTLFSFFEERLRRIQEHESLKAKIRSEIEDKLPQLDIVQLIMLFKTVYSETSLATDAILSIFRPAKDGTPSPLFQNEAPKDKDEGPLLNLSPEALEKIDKLSKIMERIKKD